MKKIEAWQCDFCAKCYVSRSSTASHQRACRNNPARKNCITCVHSCTTIEVQNYPSPSDYYQPAEVKVPWCGRHEKAIHEKPYFDDCDMKHDGWDSPEGPYPIPGTCHHYEYKGYAGWEATRQ